LFPRTTSSFVGTNDSSVVSLRILGAGGTEEIGRGKKNSFPPPRDRAGAKKFISLPHDCAGAKQRNFPSLTERTESECGCKSLPMLPSLTCQRLPSSRRCPSLPVLPIQSAPPHLLVPPLPAGVTHPTGAASLAGIASPYRFRVNFLPAPPLSAGAVSPPCRCRPCTRSCLTYLPASPLEPASPLQLTPNILNYTVSRIQRKEQLKTLFSIILSQGFSVPIFLHLHNLLHPSAITRFTIE
jgi:hypothetical protein